MDSKTSVTIESRIGIIFPETGFKKFFDLIPTSIPATAIAECLGRSVTDTQYNEKGMLILKFKDAGEIILYNDDGDFASY